MPAYTKDCCSNQGIKKVAINVPIAIILSAIPNKNHHAFLGATCNIYVCVEFNQYQTKVDIKKSNNHIGFSHIVININHEKRNEIIDHLITRILQNLFDNSHAIGRSKNIIRFQIPISIQAHISL
jgi:hypothetical protein